jgi:hypothetical protein
LPAHILILAVFVAAMALWVVLAEFWPRRRRDDEDDGEPALA